MMNKDYYLRIEGVNLEAVLADTSQISIIRGGSLLLRNAIKFITKYFSQLQPISSGASVGLFKFTASDDQAAAALCQQVAQRFNLHPRFQQLTFVVDFQPASDNFLYDKEAVLARNRFRQLQQLTIAIPAKNQEKVSGPCEVDNLRPASRRRVRLQDENKAVSHSVYERLRFGQRQKRQFYRDETGIELNFTQDFVELAQLENTTKFNNLNNKIAVLYFDGNAFGHIQAQHCQTLEDLRDFDTYIQGQRRAFLTQLLEDIKPDKTFLTSQNQLRLETLLWGGDEMIFVVPAWQGLKLLDKFYTYSQNWVFRTESLTHAGGIVFCQVGTPIQRVKDLAKDLAETVKERPAGRNHNRFDYMVLESIDYPTETLATLRKQQFGEKLSATRQSLMPFDNAAGARVKHLQAVVPKSQAYAIVRAILQESRGVAAAVTKQLTRLEEVIAQPLESITAELEQLFPQHPPDWQWLHLVDLWDYWV